MSRKFRKGKEEMPTHYPFGTRWEWTTRDSPINSTPIPARTNAARIGEEGRSGRVEITMIHPESNSRKPASFIPNPLQEIPRKMPPGGRYTSE
jgi:hypothetical protein